MQRHHAIIIVLAGALCMSFAALIIRLIEHADGFQILAYRSITQASVVGLFALYLSKQNVGDFLRKTDRIDALIAFFMMIAFGTYVLSLLNTSVASTLLILSIAPVFAALIGWVVNNEPPNLIATISIITAIIGVIIMIEDGFGGGRTIGNFLAVISALAFSMMLVTARRSKKSNVLKGNALGALLSGIVAAPIALGFSDGGLIIPLQDAGLSLLNGGLTIGLGILLISLAAPHLPAHEVSLLVLLESILSPIWVWLILSEPISRAEVTGGALVLFAVILLSFAGRLKH